MTEPTWATHPERTPRTQLVQKLQRFQEAAKEMRANLVRMRADIERMEQDAQRVQSHLINALAALDELQDSEAK